MDAGCARKSLIRAGGCTRCGFGGAAAGGVWAIARGINVARVSIDLIANLLLLLEELAVVVIVLTDELIYLGQIRA
jgi:hypothetical protein